MSWGGLGTETETTAMSTSMLEFEIPYMSPLRFVGNGLKNVRTSVARLLNARIEHLKYTVLIYLYQYSHSIECFLIVRYLLIE